MTLIFDPSIWAGFFTLIVLEIVLGIDNLVFIAIITDKLLPKKRDKARLIGLSLALIMRIGLLSLISWIVTLTHPIFILGKLNFSGRNLILLVGGLFLLFKAIIELHERLEHYGLEHQSNKHCANFWAVVIQIVILDALFSLDAIITAVGMVNNLPVMMIAVAIAMGIMLLASNPLTQFINQHPTVVVLCLSFLLMIGLSLIAEGLGFNVPKGYIYAAIGFSILIELFNQIARRNFLLQQERRPIRERTAEIILRIIGECQQNNHFKTKEESVLAKMITNEILKNEERYLINNILTLSQRSITSIMVPRDNILWVDISHSLNDIRNKLLEKPYNIFPICEGTLDKIIGVVKAKELLKAIEYGIDIVKLAANSPAVMVPETLDLIHLLPIIHQAKSTVVIVTNKFGMVQGLVSPLDILELLIGDFSKNN